MRRRRRTWVGGHRAKSAVVAWVPVRLREAFAYVAALARHPE
jgi:hypothetical protein